MCACVHVTPVCACVCVRTPLPAKRGVHVCVRALQPAELALEVSPQSRQSSCKTLSTTRVLFRRNVLAEPPPPRAPVPPKAVRTPLASGASAPRDGCDNPESAGVAPAPAWGLRGGPAAELLLVKMLTLACRGTRAGLPTGPRPPPPRSHACVFPAFLSAQARAVLLICGFFFFFSDRVSRPLDPRFHILRFSEPGIKSNIFSCPALGPGWLTPRWEGPPSRWEGPPHTAG